MTDNMQNDEWGRYRKRTARLFLIDAHNAKLTAATIEDEIAELFESADGVKAVDYRREKLSGTADDEGLLRQIERIESLVNEYRAERESCLQLNADAHSALRKVREPGRSLLTLRYMCDKRWCDVTKALADAGHVYAEVYVRKELHDTALIELFPFIPHEYDEFPEAI